mgnify:CR=1 FL=1
MLSYTIAPATAIKMLPRIAVPTVSKCPWPQGCSWSGPFPDIFKIIMTRRSVKRSDNECMPSAINAAEWDKVPNTIFRRPRIAL